MKRNNHNNLILIFFAILIFWLALQLPTEALLGELGIDPFRTEFGARPMGMGSAFSGLADDVNALLYNPGGMAWAKGVSLTLKNYENIAGIQAYPTGYGSSVGLGVIVTKLSMVPIASTGGLASSNSNLLLLSYGTKLSFLPALYRQEVFQRIGIGVNVKGLLGQTLSRQGTTDRSASGWDMDFGVLWKGSDWWSLGFSAQNILPAKSLGGGEIKWDVGDPEGIPASAKIAGAARIIGDIGSPVFMEGRELIVAGELSFAASQPLLLRLGGEWNFSRTFFLRGGVLQQSKPAGVVANLNLGLGYRTETWGWDLVSCREPLTDEQQVYFSFLYLPKEWIVVKKLEFEKPSLILEKPFEQISLQDNIETYDEKIEVFGKVKPGVEVYVNGQRAFTAEDLTFKVTVPLELGKNLVLVEAHYEGEKKLWKYKILRRAKVIIAEEKEVKKLLERVVSPEVKAELVKKEEELKAKRRKVEELVTLGVIEVTAEAEFRLEARVTRGELATWLVKAAGLRLPKVDRDIFPDVKRDHPLAPYVKVVVDWDLLRPFPDGTFRPQAPVTKEEGEKLFKLLKVSQK